MAAVGHFARKVTDSLSLAGRAIMSMGFEKKKTNAEIAREIREKTGEAVNPRTIGRRAQEWREANAVRNAKYEEMRALVAAMKEGDVRASDALQALAMQELLRDPNCWAGQNPLKVQSQNLRAEELALKRQALVLKEREVAVSEARLRALQLREERAVEALKSLENKANASGKLTAEQIRVIREDVYGLAPDQAA